MVKMVVLVFGDGDHIDNDNKIGNNEEAEDAENWANNFVQRRL